MPRPRRPDDGGDADGPDPKKQPSQSSGGINAGKGIGSAQDGASDLIDAGEPKDGGTPATTTPAGSSQPPLPNPPQPGKTHGRWTDPEGNTVPLESGRNGEYYDAARRRAVELGLTRGNPRAEAAIARHVEIQFVMRMIATGQQHAEIEVNRPVCGTTPRDQHWPDTCDKWISRFLPPGWTLVVRDGSSPEGRRYVGEG